MERPSSSRDRAAVDREIERLKALVDLGASSPARTTASPRTPCGTMCAYYCDAFAGLFA